MSPATSCTFSLDIRLARCFSTVFTLMFIIWAMAVLVCPSAISYSTSRSRGVSRSKRPGSSESAGWVKNSSRSDAEIAGLR